MHFNELKIGANFKIDSYYLIQYALWEKIDVNTAKCLNGLGGFSKNSKVEFNANTKIIIVQ